MPRAQAYARKALEIDPLLGGGALLAGHARKRLGMEQPPVRQRVSTLPGAESQLRHGDHQIRDFVPVAHWPPHRGHRMAGAGAGLDPLSLLVHADYALNAAYCGLDEKFERETARVIENEYHPAVSSTTVL